MRILRRLLILFLVIGSTFAARAQAPLVLKLKTVQLSNGWSINGTITIDGTIGPLTANNIVDWKLQMVQTSDLTWTERDSNDLNISGVSTDGTTIFVNTFPNPFTDGGALYVGRGGGGGRIPTNAVIADFTQLSVNLGYVGGVAGWQDELLGLNYIGLNQPNGKRYKAAQLDPAKPNVFNIRVPQIAPPPYKITLFGTITTDGTIGMLAPQNLVAWKITARMQDIATYSPANTQVMAATGVSYDGVYLLVAHAGGQLRIGLPGARPTYVNLADFTDSKRPNGYANYYLGNYGVMGEKSPLVPSGAKMYALAKQ
jgi:hypothetical protein